MPKRVKRTPRYLRRLRELQAAGRLLGFGTVRPVGPVPELTGLKTRGISGQLDMHVYFSPGGSFLRRPLKAELVRVGLDANRRPILALVVPERGRL